MLTCANCVFYNISPDSFRIIDCCQLKLLHYTIIEENDYLFFRTIEKYADQLDTLYARWKIQAPLPTPTEPPTVDSSLGNAELALIILGSVVGLLLLLGLCFAIKTRCRYFSEALLCFVFKRSFFAETYLKRCLFLPLRIRSAHLGMVRATLISMRTVFCTVYDHAVKGDLCKGY